MTDIARDEYLRTALRHAPDATLAAPAVVSTQIVAAAHRAAAEPAPEAPGRRRGWRLPVWRLGPSGALASLLLAGVLGLLWYEAPPGPARMDETVQAPAAPPAGVSIAPPARVSDAPAAGVREGPAAVVSNAPAVTAKTEAHAPAPGRALPAPAAEKVEPAPSSRPARALRERPPPDPGMAPPASPETVAAAVPQAAAPPALLPQAPAMGAAEPTARAAAADVTGPTAAEAAADAAEPTAAAAAARAVAAEGSASSATPSAALARRTVPARAPAQAEGLAAPPAAPGPPWADILRQPIGGAEAESGAAATAWLQELDRQTLGPWRTAPDPMPPTEPPDFVLSRGATTAGRLWLRAGQVLWCDAAGSCQQAPLQGGAEATLRQRLPRPR